MDVLMSAIWFIAVERFSPRSGQKWADYMAWAELPQLQELVSLDNMLCPSAIHTLTKEDWKHNVQADYLTDFFSNLEYLVNRVGQPSELNILAVMREPDQPAPRLWQDSHFVFQGYDLIEEPGRGISALSNCGGFDKAFQSGDLSEVGLLPGFELAQALQQRLRTSYPDELHADCCIWAIWKMVNP
jgi:hypothetical protein